MRQSDKSRHRTPGRRAPRPTPARAVQVAREEARRCDLERQNAVAALEAYKEESRQQHDELLEAHQALEESRDRYASLFDYAPVALLSVRRNGIIMDVNLRGAEMLDSTRARIVGLPLLTFILRDDHRTFLGHMLQCRRQHNAVNTELRLKTRLGRVVRVMLSAWMTAAQFRPEFEFRTAITDLTERHQAIEREAEYQRDLRSLASELSLAEERERRRIAVEIHDNLSQNLALIKMKLGMLGQRAQPEEVRRGLREAVELLDPVLERTRSLTFELSPPVLYELGLEEALEWLAEQMAQRHRLPVRFEGAPKADRLAAPVPHNVAVMLFQAVRELLMNVVKHAQARRVTVRAERADGTIEVGVRDDGRGFGLAPTAAGRNGERPRARHDLHGFGLFSIRTRLEHLGGSMRVRSSPGAGAEITLLMPLPAPAAVNPEDPRTPGGNGSTAIHRTE